MIQASLLIDELCTALDATDPDERKKVLRTLNLQYFDIAGMASWSGMRRSISAAHGDYLPSDLIGVDAIYDSEGNIYQAREAHNVILGADDPQKRWYYDQTVTSPLARGSGVTIANGASSVAFSPALSVTPTDEYMIVPGQLGFIKLSSATALASPYYGPALNGAAYEIRPRGTKRLALMDEAGDDDDTTVTVDYWAYPEPIYDENAVIQLPSTEALLLCTLRRYYKVIKKDLPRGNSLNDEIEDAIADMRDRNVKYAAPGMPRNRRGGLLTWGASRT